MLADDWRALIGESAFDHIVGPTSNDPGAVARMLSRAIESGFRAPEQHPVVSPDRAKVLWPRVGPHGVTGYDPVLTAAGLEKHWRIRGHGWLIMRSQQLARAVAGPMLPWLQILLGAYETQCEADGVDPLPVDVRFFVGGKEDGWSDQDLGRALEEACPAVDEGAIQRKTFRPSSQA